MSLRRKDFIKGCTCERNGGLILMDATQLLKNYIYEWLLYRSSTLLGLKSSREFTHLSVKISLFKPNLGFIYAWVMLFSSSFLEDAMFFLITAFSHAEGSTWNSPLSLFFPHWWPWHLCWKSFGHIPVDLFLVSLFCFIDLYVCLFFFFFFWPCHVACRILVPWSGIEPSESAVS